MRSNDRKFTSGCPAPTAKGLRPGYRRVRDKCRLCHRPATLLVDRNRQVRWIYCFYGQHDRDSIRAACGYPPSDLTNEVNQAAAADRTQWARRLWDGGV